MGHALKRVDFIITFPEQTWLIEVKDPETLLFAGAIQEAVGFQVQRAGDEYGRLEHKTGSAFSKQSINVAAGMLQQMKEAKNAGR